ncbi:hypothetical protein GALMADRAFT_146613 [Galerina marginata CBS 339.88]|uniref:F-box domain-containing protein n=1 Tax=Galerina marginata (strain CBS 339.88) TaxID=685588 RepID=A0A067SMY0_GALM3|nr:hypothetical protein GALMADRAFT_146613 [Galerina marginata CBS 339.88]
MQTVFPVSPKAPWLFDLRIACVYLPLERPLAVLKTMYHLESLTISTPTFPPDSPATHANEAAIYLLDLSQLYISTNLSTAMRIIRTVHVPPGCSFRISILGADVITEPFSPGHLLKLTHNYFQSNRPKKVWLTVQPCEFLFTLLRPGEPIMADTIGLLTDAMTLPLSDMHCVMQLHINAQIPFAVDICEHVFLCLRSIKTMTINRELISYLRWFHSYPDLRIIRIEGWKNDEQSYDVNLFQKLRNAGGRPVLILGVPSPQ